jgi:hypothetical protein
LTIDLSIVVMPAFDYESNVSINNDLISKKYLKNGHF